MEASKTQFACANPEKSEKTKQIIQSIVQDEYSKVDVNKVKARNVPDFVCIPSFRFTIYLYMFQCIINYNFILLSC